MNGNKTGKKKVTFEENPNRHVVTNTVKKSSILKIKGKNKEENEYNNKPSVNSNDIKNLPTSEYIQATVQKEIEEGLMNIALLQPPNPIEFLGNYLIEKSKNPS